MKYKFMRYGGVMVIIWSSLECMRKNTLVPLIAPLIGAMYAVVWIGIAEMYKGERKK